MNVYVSALSKISLTSHRKRTQKSITEALDKIGKFFQKPIIKNLTYFVKFLLGVASNWIDAIDQIMTIVGRFEIFYELITNCNPIFKKIRVEETNGKKVETELILEDKNEVPDTKKFFDSVDNTQKFCMDQTKQIQDKIVEYNQKNGVDFCETPPTDDVYDKETTIYDKNIKKWIENCKYYRDVNCSKIKEPEVVSDFTRIARTIKKYYTSIKTHLKTFIECKDKFLELINQKDLLKPLTDEVKKTVEVFKKWLTDKLLPSILQWIGKSVFAPVLNYLTVGLWGEIKAAYYVYKFYKLAKKFYEDNFEDGYKAGQLIGSVIKIITSFVLGNK